MGVPEISIVLQFTPPFVDFNIVFITVPARIVVKFVFAAKDVTKLLRDISNIDESFHAVLNDASPEYIILLLLPSPPTIHRLYTPPIHNDVIIHLNLEGLGLFEQSFQLNPSWEIDNFLLLKVVSPPVARKRVLAVFVFTDKQPRFAVVKLVPPNAAVFPAPGTRDQEEPPSPEYINDMYDKLASEIAFVI
jgi:hypothetical protein